MTSKLEQYVVMNDHILKISNDHNKNYLKEDFQTQDSIEKAQNYIDNLVNQVVEQTKNDATDIKIKKVIMVAIFLIWNKQKV